MCGVKEVEKLELTSHNAWVASCAELIFYQKLNNSKKKKINNNNAGKIDE